jgi:hypothetical protein
MRRAAARQIGAGMTRASAIDALTRVAEGSVGGRSSEGGLRFGRDGTAHPHERHGNPVRYSVAGQAPSARNLVPSKSLSYWNMPWIA